MLSERQGKNVQEGPHPFAAPDNSHNFTSEDKNLPLVFFFFVCFVFVLFCFCFLQCKLKEGNSGWVN